MIEILTLETPSLGDRSYLATDGDVAAVIDPQRDVDRVLDLAAERRVRITHVAETHIHNDYVSGGLALARRVGAEYLVSADDRVAFDRRPVRDGEVVGSGGLRLRVLHTPGHTFTHLSYVLEDAGGRTHGVFTGGSLLLGSTGRPDLLGPGHTRTLARLQHGSAHRLAGLLPGTTTVLPTHGFGSFCAAGPMGASGPTLADQMRTNPALTTDRDAFVETVLAGLQAYPAYYAHMAPLNAAGPGPAHLALPREADAVELGRRLRAGEWVVDLRSRTAYAAGHLPGTVSIGLDGGFATWLGWLVPWGSPLTLLAATPDDVLRGLRELCRIGIDGAEAMATGDPAAWAGGRPLATYPRAGFSRLARERATGHRPCVLDVRRADERAAGALPGSLHVPLHELPRRLDEVPHGRPVWVHCAVGYRACIAASILERAGREVVLVDDRFPADVTGSAARAA